MWGTAQCLGKNWPFISASPCGPHSLASVEPNDTSAIMQGDPFIHIDILYVRSAHHSMSNENAITNIVPRCMIPQSPKLYVVNNLQPCSTLLSISLYLYPYPHPSPSAQHPSSLPLSVRWRLQKCTITGLTHITKDTSQLLQALSISQMWFPIVQAMAFLLSPATRAHPSTTHPNPPHVGPSPGPQERSRKHNSYCYSCHLGLLGTRVSISRVVVFSQVVAMVNMPSNKQQRENKSPNSSRCIPHQISHGLQKKIWLNHCWG